MKLYIANCTKQIMSFAYRTADADKMMQQTIQIGGQIQVYKDTDHASLDYIIQQHAPYGLIDVAEIDRSKGFIGACYQFDHQIDVSKVIHASEHNDDFLAQMGLEYRKQAAVSLNDQLQKDSEGAVSSLSVEVHEEAKPGSDKDSLMTEQIDVGDEQRAHRGRGRPRKG